MVTIHGHVDRLVLCHAYKLGLTEGQEVVGAKRGGKCIGIYIDDERQSSRPPGPRPAGLAANAPSAASPRFKGSTDPVFTAASCIWSVCRQSTLICRRDRALVHGRIFAVIALDRNCPCTAAWVILDRIAAVWVKADFGRCGDGVLSLAYL